MIDLNILESSYEAIDIAQVTESEKKGVLQHFSDFIWDFYAQHKREFPWRETSDCYRVLLSELMLQQTQTERVLPKYHEFITRWPTFSEMASSSLLEVLSTWKGLGYNRRALALREIAKKTEQYGWNLPDTHEELIQFPMVGPATAAAILSFCYQKPAIYLETNIRRVLIHHFFPCCEQVHDRSLRDLLQQLVVLQSDYKGWYYALMDYGAYMKKIVKNPNRRSAHYTKQPRFENSNRHIRGTILLLCTEEGPQNIEQLSQRLPFEEQRIAECLKALEKEGFLSCVSEEELLYRISPH